MSRLFDGSLETSSLEPEQPLEVNNDFYAAYNNYVMENYTAKQGGDGIVAEDAKWLLKDRTAHKQYDVHRLYKRK